MDANNKATHTPGPWKVDSLAEKILGANKSIVVYETNANEADIALIAAAPDLLAAVESQRRAIDWLMARVIELNPDFLFPKSPIWPALLDGLDAIAKARS